MLNMPKSASGKGRPIVKYRDTAVSCAKTAEPIEMQFEIWTRIGHRLAQSGAYCLCGGDAAYCQISFDDSLLLFVMLLLSV